MPSVSVVIPALNNADTLEEAIVSCLDQPEVGEVVVALAPSTDHSHAVVDDIRDSRVRLIDNPRKGISFAMNLGLAECRGKYVAKIDADDAAITGRFERQSAFLDSQDQFAAVCGAHEGMDEAGKFLAVFGANRPAGDITDLYLDQERVAHFGTWLTRVEALRKIGGFREWFVTSEDSDTAFRLAFVGRVWFDPEPVYRFRIRNSSITHTQPNLLRKFYEAKAVEFARQRKQRQTDDLEEGRPPALPSVSVQEAQSAIDPRDQAASFRESEAWRRFQANDRLGGLRLMAHSLATSSSESRLGRLRSLAVMTIRSVWPNAGRR